jgi:hypothetical protein
MYQGLSYEIEQVMPQAIATGLFVSLCTIQNPDGTLDASGAPTGNFVPIPGLVAIPCTAPPTSDARIQATEAKSLDEILSFQLHHVLLNGYYEPLFPPVPRTALQALIAPASDPTNTEAFEVMGFESDSQYQMTRIELRLAQI